MAYGPTDEEAGVAALRRAHDLCVTFFDTAEMYGWGTGSNEILPHGGFGARYTDGHVPTWI